MKALRQKPGTSGKGHYFHVIVKPKGVFKFFRTQDVGEKGHIQRVAGKKANGSWNTVKWLISKEDAHIESNNLIPDSKEAEDLLNTLDSKPVYQKGDVFKAKPAVPASQQKSVRNADHHVGEHV